jgi:hypothetical protein
MKAGESFRHLTKNASSHSPHNMSKVTVCLKNGCGFSIAWVLENKLSTELLHFPCHSAGNPRRANMIVYALLQNIEPRFLFTSMPQ